MAAENIVIYTKHDSMGMSLGIVCMSLLSFLIWCSEVHEFGGPVL